jgi:ABC-type branched-subunit amino acid transport system ATPase component
VSVSTGISVRGLSKDFDDVSAVDGLGLDIADGEFFSMLGPSGSGKTTVDVVAAVLVGASAVPSYLARRLSGDSAEAMTGAH